MCAASDGSSRVCLLSEKNAPVVLLLFDACRPVLGCSRLRTSFASQACKAAETSSNRST